MAAGGLVDGLAHIDLVKIHGHRPTAGIRQLAAETLDFIATRGLAIELSTAGWRKPVNELYPSDDIIQMAIAGGIPFTTASDAHSHVQLGENYARLAATAARFEISHIAVYERHRRALVRIEPEL
jgi:histidinol-phosphatase (PHP family)